MKEATIRQRFLEECRKRNLFAFPIETGMVYGGIPDICITGRKTVWVELKWVIRWPVKAETIVKRDLLRPAQINWMRDYDKDGGTDAWLFVRVEDVYFLFDHSAALWMNQWTKGDFVNKSVLFAPVRGTAWDAIFEEMGLSDDTAG